MPFHKSIPERPHGGTPPSWASTSVAAPPARSDPSGARVPPFARAPESRPAFHLTARRRGVADRGRAAARCPIGRRHPGELPDRDAEAGTGTHQRRARARSEEHTSELQSRSDLVCRLLLEKKKNKTKQKHHKNKTKIQQ